MFPPPQGEGKPKLKYEYITTMGKTEIEVDEHFYEILTSLDNEEYNSNRKHSRRWPVSLECVDYEGEWFSDDTNLLGDLVQAENLIQLHEALLRLTSDQQKLIERIYYKNEANVDIAREDNVSEAAIRNRLKKIHNRLKKILS